MDEETDQADLPRGKRMLMALSTAIYFALFLGFMLVSVLEPGGTFWLGRRAQDRIALTREEGLAIFLPLIAFSALLVVRGVRGQLRQIWSASRAGAVAPEIPPGETVLWIGRPGWRSLSIPRLIGLLMAIVVPSGSAWWMWSIVASDGLLAEKLFALLVASFFVFGIIVPGLIGTSGMIGGWISDACGCVAVTRSRVVWLTPLRRRIYRQVAGADIIDAFVTPSDPQRGSVTIIKRLRDDVEHVHVEGLSEPESALGALQMLIMDSNPAPRPLALDPGREDTGGCRQPP